MSTEIARDEFESLVQTIKDTYPDNFADLDPSKILYLRSTAKSKLVADIKPIKGPLADHVTNLKFVLTVFSANYDEQEPAHQHLHIFRQLLRITDFNEAKMEDFPIKDHPYVLGTFGLNWQEEDTIPDVLDKAAMNAAKGK